LCAWKGKMRWICSLAVGAACVSSLAFYFTSTVKEDWRSTVRYVEAASKGGDLLLFGTDFDETSYARYAVRSDQRLRILASSSSTHLLVTDRAGGLVSDAAPTLAQHPRVWLILSGGDTGLEVRYRTYFSGWDWEPGTSFRGITVRLLEQRGQIGSGTSTPLN
jgi:hypothetical protein